MPRRFRGARRTGTLRRPNHEPSDWARTQAAGPERMLGPASPLRVELTAMRTCVALTRSRRRPHRARNARVNATIRPGPDPLLNQSVSPLGGPQPAKPAPNEPFLFGGLPLLAASVLSCRRRQSSSRRVCALLECRHQGGHLTADLGCEVTRRPRGLQKLASAPLMTGAGCLVGRRLIASGLALKRSSP